MYDINKKFLFNSKRFFLQKKLSKVCSVDELTDLKKQLEAKQDEIKALREKLDAANAKKSNPPPAVAAEVPESFTLEMRKLQVFSFLLKFVVMCFVVVRTSFFCSRIN